ncbi:MAG: ATP synthase F1 subunit gamma [Chloroflexota bacterium]|nr:ATP synthase F1 subunit gamma [Chloroflexota bacterium]
MPSLRQIRRRIRTVQNTGKITRAMEMVAAVKMRRAQQATMAARPYAEKMAELLSHLAGMPSDEDPHPLLQNRPIERVTLVHMTPDRGLCGALPGNLNRRAGSFILEDNAGTPVSVVTVGRKGRDFMVRANREVQAVFDGLGDRPELMDIVPLARLIMDSFVSGETDAVFISFGQFVNTIVQRPTLQQLLPVVPAELAADKAVGYIYEPLPADVLDALLPRYVEMELYHAVLEGIASEQSARMVAMRNATDNASDLVKDLTLEANKVRQEAITNELLDIIGGTLTFQ